MNATACIRCAGQRTDQRFKQCATCRDINRGYKTRGTIVRANGCVDCNTPRPAHEERCALCRKVHAKRQAALQVAL